MKTQRQILGARGEQAAAQYLSDRGYEVVDRNWRCSDGELDLVVKNPRGAIVGVEVKTRSSRRYGTGFEAVNAVKYRRLRRLMLLWARHQGLYLPRITIDVIEVYAQDAGFDIEHIQDVRS